MSLKTLESIKYPSEIPLNKAALAWGVTPEELQKYYIKTIWSANEVKKFLIKNTNLLVNHRPSNTLKEYFVRFMVLSLNYPLIEDPVKALLQLMERDYLKEADINEIRKKIDPVLNKPFKETYSVREKTIVYYKESKKDYIAQFPRRVLVDCAGIYLHSETYNISSPNPNPEMIINLVKCTTALTSTLFLIPLVDKFSNEIINENVFLKSINPIVGSLRLRKPVADRHTTLSIN
jgi:hypothetical protein